MVFPIGVNTADMEALKTRQKSMWMSGDYAKFATYLLDGAMEFLAFSSIPTSARVLDVGCGAGQTAIPMARQVYAIPHEWTEKLGIRRYGFHGASHRYIATRVPELVGKDRSRRIISCHLGGSCSVCAIQDGKSVANSFGMTAQSGVPHNNRVGDFDTFALLKLTRQGHTLDEVFKKLSKEGGMYGMSGVSPDMRDVEAAAAGGNPRARLAIDAFVESVRHYVGAYLVALGGCDVLAFTGGIGENGIALREAICRNLGWAGIALDPQKNMVRAREEKISSVESDAEIWIVPTNEELIVARQTEAVLTAN